MNPDGLYRVLVGVQAASLPLWVADAGAFRKERKRDRKDKHIMNRRLSVQVDKLQSKLEAPHEGKVPAQAQTPSCSSTSRSMRNMSQAT